MGKRFENAPLIYPTLVKSALFTVVLLIFKLIEEVAVGYFRNEPISRSLAGFAGGTWWGILSYSLIMWVVLMPFVSLWRIATSSGRKEIDSDFLRRAFRVNAAVVVTFDHSLGSSVMTNSVTHFEIYTACNNSLPTYRLIEPS